MPSSPGIPGYARSRLERQLLIGLIPLTLIVSAIAGGFAYLNHFESAVAEAKAKLLESAKTHADIENDMARQIAQNLIRLRPELIRRIDEPDPAAAKKFAATTEPHSVIALHRRRTDDRGNPFDPARQAEILFPRNRHLTEHLRHRLLVAAEFCEAYGPVLLRTRFAQNFFFVTPESGVAIFWPTGTPSRNLSADYDFTNEPFLANLTCEKNPRRTLAWSPPYLDMGTGIRMITATIPIDASGIPLGVIGCDLDLTEITKRLTTHSSPNCVHLIHTGDHSLLMDSNAANEALREISATEEIRNTLSLATKTVPASGRVADLMKMNAFAAIVPIPDLGAHYVIITPRSDLFLEASASTIDAIISLLAIFSIQLIILLVLVRRIILTPILTIANATYKLARTSTPNPITHRFNDEIGDLTDALNGMAMVISERDKALRAQQQVLTERVRIRTAELNAARKEAEHATREKTTSLNHITKEFRSPLKAIRSFAASLTEDHRLNGDQIERSTQIARASQSLLDALSDIDEITGGEQTRVSAPGISVDIATLITELCEAAKQECRAKGLTLRIDIANLPSGLTTATGRLRRAISALLHHAILYSDAGEISLFASARLRPEKADYEITIEVRDTGPGLPSRGAEALFDTLSPGSGLTHLQLAAAREFARQNLGDIIAENAPNGGGLLRLTFIAHKEQKEPTGPTHTHPKTPPAETPSAGTKKTALVVDDDAMSREVLSAMLERLGYAVRSAGTGDDGIAQLKSAPADLVLFDAYLPRISGTEMICRYLTGLPADTPRPITYCISSRIAESDIEQLRQTGITGFLPKPFRAAELRTALEGAPKPTQ